MVSLGKSIDMVKDVLSKGSLLVTGNGICSRIDDKPSTLDFNVSTEHDVGENTHGFKMTDLVSSTADTPQDFRQGDDPRDKQDLMKKNQRDILRKFNIRVIVYPERVEIKGAIPIQILDKTDKEKTARIISWSG